MKNKLFSLFLIGVLLFTSITIFPLGCGDLVKQNAIPTEEDIVKMIHQVNKSMVYYYHNNLMKFGPRSTGSVNCTLAGQYIYAEFEEMGLDVEFHEWNYGGFNSKNVVATLNGANLTNNAIFIMSAHYDCSPGSLGANDDGTGIAALLATAQIMSQYSFNHTIRFIAFSGEEVGTYGSFTYARDGYRKGENFVAVINADMVGYANTKKGSRTINFFHTERSAWIVNFGRSVSETYMDLINLSIKSIPNHKGIDQQAFVDYGYDGVWVRHDDDYPWCNTPEDTPDRLNWTYQVKATKFLVALMATFGVKPIDLQVIIKTPFEGYGYIFNYPVLPMDLGKYWYIGLRGITVLLGRAIASAEVFCKGDIEHVIFCIDDDFLFWDSDPPYEWKIHGWHYPNSIGRHKLKVCAYTKSGKVATDEMDIIMFTLPRYYGKWPPSPPCNPYPENNALNISIDIDLSWTGGDVDPGDEVTYEVYLGTNPEPAFVECIGPYPSTQTRITYDPGTLNHSTHYYWRIVSRDRQNASAESGVWEFTTV